MKNSDLNKKILKTHVQSQLKELSSGDYNIFLHFLFCLGLIQDYWYYINLRETFYTSLNPSLETWNREVLIDRIISRVNYQVKNIDDIFTEFKREKEHSILLSYEELKAAWEAESVPAVQNPFDIKPLTAEEENTIDIIRLNFIEYFPDSKGLISKYVLDIDNEFPDSEGLISKCVLGIDIESVF